MVARMDESFPSSPKLIMSTGIFSFTFVTFLLLFLHYSEYLYNVGKFSSYYLLIILILGELTKFIFNKYSKTPQRPSPSKHTNFLKSLLLILATVTIFYIIPILYGAQIFSDIEETLMLSLTLTILTTLQSLIHLGYRNTIAVLSELTDFDLNLSESQIVLKNIQGTLMGGLCGAIVIPLDWNRPWQVWPIPCFVGCILGYGVANIACSFLACLPKKKYTNRKRCV